MKHTKGPWIPGAASEKAEPELLEACEKALHDLRRIKAEWQIDAHESIKLLKRAINKAKEEEQK